MNRSIARFIVSAALFALLSSTCALAFTPRSPAPIQPGAIHSESAAPAKAAPAKTEAKPKESQKVAESTPAKVDPHAAPADAHAAPAPVPAPVKADAHAAPPPPPPPAPAKADAHAAPAPAHAAPAHAAPAHAEEGPVYPVEVLRALIDGNKRYASGKMTRAHQDAARRAEVAQGQHPMAIIVSCSDSRVPPEVIFDQGVGDLFVVRTAGEVVDDIALGSIEYAVEHLHAKLIVVLGHERCGAVAATVGGGHAPGHIPSIVAQIQPAVEKAQDKEGDKLTNCIVANVKMVAEKIRAAEPIISEHMKDGLVRVVGAYYDLDSGSVSITYSPDLSL